MDQLECLNRTSASRRTPQKGLLLPDIVQDGVEVCQTTSGTSNKDRHNINMTGKEASRTKTRRKESEQVGSMSERILW